MKRTRLNDKRINLRKLKKIVTALLAASIVTFLAVFFAFVPFRLLLPAYTIAARDEGELRLHFLDLEGGVTIAEFSNGEVLVVNAGNGSFESDNKLCRYLRALNITSMSVLFTGANSSHIGGAYALFETFRIQKCYLPADSADTGAYRRFVSSLDREGCEREKLARYGRIENQSGAYAVCLSPYSAESSEATIDDKSTLLYLSYAGVNVVLSGDVTQKREKKLLNEYALSNSVFDRGEYRVRLEKTDVLLASSHGSENGSSEEWLSLLSPSATVIACNKKERPSSGTIERIAAHSNKILRTDELGTIMIVIKDGNYRVQTHVLKG